MNYLISFEEYRNEKLSEGLSGWIERNSGAILGGLLPISTLTTLSRPNDGLSTDGTLLLIAASVGLGMAGHQLDKSLNINLLLQRSNLSRKEIEKISVMLKKDPVVQQQIVNITNAKGDEEKIAIGKEFERHLAKKYNVKVNESYRLDEGFFEFVEPMIAGLFGAGIAVVGFFAIMGVIGISKTIRTVMKNNKAITANYSDKDDFWDDFDVISDNINTKNTLIEWKSEISKYNLSFKNKHQGPDDDIGLDTFDDSVSDYEIDIFKEEGLYKEYTTGLEKVSKKYEGAIEKIIKQNLATDRAKKMISVINDPTFKNDFVKVSGKKFKK